METKTFEMRALQVAKEGKHIVATCYHCGQQVLIENATVIPVIQQGDTPNEDCLAFLCEYCNNIYCQM